MKQSKGILNQHVDALKTDLSVVFWFEIFICRKNFVPGNIFQLICTSVKRNSNSKRESFGIGMLSASYHFSKSDKINNELFLWIWKIPELQFSSVPAHTCLIIHICYKHLFVHFILNVHSIEFHSLTKNELIHNLNMHADVLNVSMISGIL